MGKSEVLDKYFSKELTYVLDYIIDNVHEDMHFNEISPYVFLYSALEKQESMLYTVLSSYLITEMIDNIHDGLVLLENKNSLDTNINRSKIKPEISKSLRLYLNDSLLDVRETGAELINTDHVLLSILRDNENESHSNDIISLFKEFPPSK